MAKVVTPLDCKIEAIGKPRESSYQAGQYYRPTLFIDLAQPPGTESAKIWKNLSEVEAAQLVVGDRVQLIPVGTDKSGKPKHNIVVPNATPTVPDTPPVAAEIAPVMSAQTKQEIASYVQEMARLYGYCLGQATTELKDPYDLSESSIRCVASSLFIAAQKRFSL